MNNNVMAIIADTSLFLFSGAKFLLVFLGVDHLGT